MAGVFHFGCQWPGTSDSVRSVVKGANRSRLVPLPMPGLHFMFLPGAGFGFMAIGAFLDWSREPPIPKT
jgi:hypothetical protein